MCRKRVSDGRCSNWKTPSAELSSGARNQHVAGPSNYLQPRHTTRHCPSTMSVSRPLLAAQKAGHRPRTPGGTGSPFDCTTVQLLITLPDVSRGGLKVYPWTFFSFPFLINPPRSAATQWTAMKCIRSLVKLQQLVARPPLP